MTERDNFQFHDPIKNLTNVKFLDDELNHISIGYKSKFQTDKYTNQIDNLIVQSENIIQSSNIENKDEVHHLISREINKQTQHKITKKKTKTTT